MPGGDPRRHQRLGGAPLGGDERREKHHEESGEPENLPRAPGVGAPGPGRGQHEDGDRGGHQRDAEPVDHDLAAPGNGRKVEHQRAPDEAHQADGDVDVERPAPAEVRGDETTDQRAADAADRLDDRYQALVPAALARREQDTDQRERSGQQATGPDALQGSEADQLAHGRGLTRQGRADHEHHDRAQEEELPVVQVAELSPDRDRARAGEGVGDHYPGDVVQPADLADDRWHRCADYQAVELAEQHGQQDAEHDPADVLRHGGYFLAAARGGSGHGATPFEGTTSIITNMFVGNIIVANTIQWSGLCWGRAWAKAPGPRRVSARRRRPAQCAR